MKNRDRERTQQWKTKYKTSPFHVNLVAENERIEEENNTQLRHQERAEAAEERRRHAGVEDLLRRAADETAELEELRAQKRHIASEERRLRALLDLEKTRTRCRDDLAAAAAAERGRGRGAVLDGGRPM